MTFLVSVTTETRSDIYFHVQKHTHTQIDHAVVSDDAPDEFHSPCWQSLTTTTCRWCAPTQLALIQTWDRGRNIRRGGMSGFHFFPPLRVVLTKLIKQGAGSRVLTKTRTLRKRRRRRKKQELVRAQDGGLGARGSSPLASPPLFPFSPFPQRPLVKKMSNDHASVSTIWQLVHL